MKLALFARLEAKPGKEQEVADFLRQGLALANQEATTLMWFALRVGPTTPISVTSTGWPRGWTRTTCGTPRSSGIIRCC